jgi:endonuclease G
MFIFLKTNKQIGRIMTNFSCRYLFVLLIIATFQSCGTCSQHHVNTPAASDGVEAPYVNHVREVWSTLANVGFPVIPDSTPSLMLERNCYTTSYNKVTRQPNWVMWQLTGEHVMQRKEGIWNEYREDAELPAEERATLDDYASSGYDRGHMCPGGDCNWDDKGRDETFVLSNMCPQNPNLNRGDWKEIEMACRKWAQKYGSIYIVCGPMFFKSQMHERIGPHQVPVPEAFFKERGREPASVRTHEQTVQKTVAVRLGFAVAHARQRTALRVQTVDQRADAFF